MFKSLLILTRFASGIRTSSFHGNFFVRSTDLLTMPAVPQDQSYAIEMEIDEPLADVKFVVFQTVVLHTTSLGEPPYFRLRRHLTHC
jgi:protein transport protein SEC24